VLEWTDAKEAELPADALLGADEAFLTSSTRDVQAITEVDGRPLATGAVTTDAAQAFAIRSGNDLDP